MYRKAVSTYFAKQQVAIRKKQITLKAIVNESDNRINRILFKLAVEQAISMNVIAATCNINREQLDQLRAMCVNQVKKTSGSYSFQNAYDLQKSGN